MKARKQSLNRKLTLLLIIALAMLSVSCNNEQVNHTTYRYVFDSLTTTTFHINDQVKIMWKAEQIPPSNNAISQTKPDRVLLEASLSQGSSSIQNVKQTKDVVSSTSTKVVTDDWTNKIYERSLLLPSIPGYYDLTFSTTVYEGNSPAGTTTVKSIITVVK